MDMTLYIKIIFVGMTLCIEMPSVYMYVNMTLYDGTRYVDMVLYVEKPRLHILT